MSRFMRVALTIAWAGLGCAAASATAAPSGKKVTLCHRPPGNAQNRHQIRVAEASVDAHMKHGDQIGPCDSGCEPGGPTCDDGNPCTADECRPDGSCQHTAVNCDDGNACTTDLCDSTTGCLSIPSDGGPCDDGDACTTGDACEGGRCEGTAAPGCCATDAECQDPDACTVDRCLEGVCRHESLDCSRSDKCLVGFCDPTTGACTTQPVTCDDSNVCTEDVCDTTLGCVFLPNPNPPEANETSCADQVDNDCDGAIDRDDSDCIMR
jgi:slime mold repeat-containing protein